MGELEKLREELAQHIKEELALHRKEIDEILMLGEERFDHIVACQKDTCEKLDKLITNTDPIVEFMRDAQAAGRIATYVQSVAFWVLKWGAIVGSFVAVVEFGKLAIKKLTGH